MAGASAFNPRVQFPAEGTRVDPTETRVEKETMLRRRTPLYGRQTFKLAWTGGGVCHILDITKIAFSISPNKPAISGVNNLITLACSFFEKWPADNRDFAAAVFDRSFALQFASGNCQGGSLYAQHMSQKLLSQAKLVGFHPVRRGE